MNKLALQILSEKLMELGNIAIGALVFTQIIGSNQGFKIIPALIGVIILLLCYTGAIINLRNKTK